MAAPAIQGWMIYQPLIVGLGAVVLAAIGNTLVEWTRHTLTERKEKTTLRRTLLLEFMLARKYLQPAAERLAKTSGECAFPFPVDFPLLATSAARFGMLPWNEGEVASRAYGNLVQFHETLLRRPAGSVGEHFRVYSIPEDGRESLAAMAARADASLEQAIATLREGRL